MIKNSLTYTILLLSALLSPNFIWGENPIKQSEEALTYYTEGEAARSLKEREEAFNKALTIYSELASKYPSGELYYNLANCYFQLGEYSWATLYYYRAKARLPRDQKIQLNLALTQQKLNLIQCDDQPSTLKTILYPHYKLSAREKWGLFSNCSLITFALLSFFTWKRWRPLLLSAACFFVSRMISAFDKRARHFSGGIFLSFAWLSRNRLCDFRFFLFRFHSRCFFLCR